MTETIIAVSRLKIEFPYDYELISETISRIRKAGSRGELGKIIAAEVQAYSVPDLQVIGGRLNNEIAKIPNPYRDAVRPYFISQIFGMHHELLLMNRTGKFDTMNGPVSDRETFQKFCDTVPEGCFSWDESGVRNPFFRRPRNRLFYYLIAAFTMFVLEKPGHPVGMPFPGGFRVELKGDTYYCLIRDKEKEVFYSICNFCPAVQSEESPAS
ncbi:MAG TPA: DUF2115 domain-containing protein [Methanoregulaceae archaeon]|nr:DUF2115 domain-containing protein [Methanoregulaceae archaeon]